MSLIIKGMEMPQAGDVIICGQIEGKLQCTIVTRGKPTKWCEASEVSTPHGRLIDAEKLLIALTNDSHGLSAEQVITIMEFLTIIEAEMSE